MVDLQDSPGAIHGNNRAADLLDGRSACGLVHPAAVLAVIHFVWRVKTDLREPLLYGFVLGIQLFVRAPAHLFRRLPPCAGRAPPAIIASARE